MRRYVDILVRPRMVLTYFDQSLSSGTGLAASVLAAGSLSADDFGSFAVAASIMIVLVGLIRSATGSLLMVVLPAESIPQNRTAMVNGARSAATMLALVLGAISIAAGLVAGGTTGAAVASGGIALPLVAIQDVQRHVALAQTRPGVACVSDGVWLAATCTALIALRMSESTDVWLVVLATYCPSILGLMATGEVSRRSRWHGGSSWLNLHLRSSVHLAGDFMLALSYGAVPLVLISALNADLELAGAVRVAQTLLGPLMILYAASSLHLQPRIASGVLAGPVLRSVMLRQSGSNVIVAISIMVMSALVPKGVGESLFGPSWENAQSVIGFVGAGYIGIAMSTGPLTVLRASGRFRAGLIAQASTAASVWCSMAVLGLATDNGVLLGFGVGNVAGAMIPSLVSLRFARTVPVEVPTTHGRSAEHSE